MHAPVASPTREANGTETPDGGPMTERVPIFCPPMTAHALVQTPPPSSERRLSRSVVSHNTENECGVGLRVGDTFHGFHLVEELGQGAFARVFLAHQESLAGRPVALKVTLRPTREAERLARLQHTNVVPVYSVHNAPPVQVICMPYLGRRTIADVVRSYRNELSSRDLSGRRTSGTRATARTTNAADSGVLPKSGVLSTIVRPASITLDGAPDLIGDPIAVLRVLAQLAAGLAHAHERGILHLDLKPANVLLPDIGEPMLLDFNLSFDTTNADRELVGGTVPYMATEQLIDLRTRGRGQVDARTDLYSLGVMAFEMLTGNVPFPASSKDLIDMDGLIASRRMGPPSIRELNPAVTPAIEAIVQKLLAPEPADRYQSANELKTDIERHLADRPLQFACERSLGERLGKWRRRNPGVAVRLAAACLFGLVVGLGAIAYQNHDAKSTAEAAAFARTMRDSLDTTRLDLILPDDAKARARGIARAEEILASYGLPNDADWMNRPRVSRLSEQDRVTLKGELGELALLLAQAKWKEAEPKTGEDLTNGAAAALKFLRAARSCFLDDAIPPGLEKQAADMAFAAVEEIESITEKKRELTTRDRFLEAAAAIGSRKYSDALALLEQVVKKEPQHAPGQFCLAYCKEQLGQHDAALERYEVAQSLLPKDARPAVQHGIIHMVQAKHQEAVKDFTQAIDLDPVHPLAHRNRGFAQFRLGERNQERSRMKEAEAFFKNAEADLTKALALGAGPMQIHLYRAQVRQKLGNTVGAVADRTTADALIPKSEADFISRGLAKLRSEEYQSALEDFRAAAVMNPRSFAAFKNQIYVLADKLREMDAALVVATRMTEVYPDYATGRMMRAMLLARLGKRSDAHAETDEALRLAPKDPDSIYRAACVYSLTSVIDAGDKVKSLELLDRAIKSGYSAAGLINSDHDLDGIRHTKRFREIADAAASLFQ
jgi:serine/threonine protein kinase/Flp pilus assembly protein TadD